MKFIKIKGPRETRGLRFDEKSLPAGRNLTKFDNLPQGCGGYNAWPIRQACALVDLLLVAKVSFENQKSFGFFSQIVLQRNLSTNWFLATFLAYQLELNLDEERNN